MAYADDLIKLRKKIADAIAIGVVDDGSKDLYEATLIQVMNEAERQRQTCVGRAEDLRRQAAIADGQSAAFSQVSSIIYNIINGYIVVAEKQKREELEAQVEKERLNEEAAADVVEMHLTEEKTKIVKKKSLNP